jgi:SAM-dependent methyltransferase
MTFVADSIFATARSSARRISRHAEQGARVSPTRVAASSGRFSTSATLAISPLEANELAAFYTHWIVEPFLTRCPAPGSILDVGAGYGWLSIAFALHPALPPSCRIIALEPNYRRLQAARHIAASAGVDHRIEWCSASLGALPFADQSMQAVFAIEVIEHIFHSQQMIRDLGRVCGNHLVITTPNRRFPVIMHDTALPFCHQLPIPLRDLYARLFGRADRQDGNLFWSPGELARGFPQFERVSALMHFSSSREYVAANRCLPAAFRDGWLHESWCRAAGLLGQRSTYLLPTCSMVLRRRQPRP